MRVAVLDDYQLAVPELSCLDRLGEVEALVLIRERTPVTADLLERLPALCLQVLDA